MLHCNSVGDVRLLGCTWRQVGDEGQDWVMEPDSNAMELLAIQLLHVVELLMREFASISCCFIYESST